MKRIISLAIAALTAVSVFASCAPAAYEKPASSADGVAKYTAYLEEHLDKMPEELTVATAETSAAYGVDMSEFADDGYFIRAEEGEVVILGKTDAGLDRAVRDYVKNGNESDYFKVFGEGYRVDKLTIAGNDISEYAIIRDDDADYAQALASSELAKYIWLACGADLPQFSAAEYAAASDKPARTIRFTVDYPALGDEAYTINIGDDANVTISGGRWRGCIYGSYDLLEDIGWRFITDADESNLREYLYASEHVDLTSALNRTESSPFSYRKAYGGYREAYRSEKYKDHYNPKLGAYGLTDVSCHGLQNWYSSIFTPDVYAGPYETGYQPCLTNEDILECIESFVIRRVESALAAGQTLGKELVYIDLSQWDGVSECTCNNCHKLRNSEGTKMATWLYMGNRSAQLLKDNGYDDVWISLLAYHGTDIAPKKMKPLDNVRISYCFYPWPCMNHSLSGEDCAGGSNNLNYHKQFLKWKELCTNDNLDVWYYPLLWDDTHIAGAPILEGMYDSIQYLADHGTDGVMAHSTGAEGAALHSLITYLCSRLLWDPYMSREEYYAYAKEWFMIIYGDDVGELFHQYYMMLERAGNANKCFNTLHGGQPYQGLIARHVYNHEYIAENFDYFVKIFDEAHILAESERVEKLVRRYRASMLYLCIGFTYDDNYVNGTEEQRSRMTELYRELHTYMKEFGFSTPGDSALQNLGDFDPNVSPYVWFAKDYGKEDQE